MPRGTPTPPRRGLRQQVLLAALDCSGGDLGAVFTAEDLLLAAWKRDPIAWGLRGHEYEHPDSEKIYVELDRASVGGAMFEVDWRVWDFWRKCSSERIG